MVRVPGSSGDSQGFHREPDEDDTKIKLEPGIEALAEGVSPQTLLSEAGYTHRQSAGRSSVDDKEGGPAMDLEEKPRPPPQAPAGAPAERNSRYVSPDEGPLARADRPSSTTTPPALEEEKTEIHAEKLKAPDPDVEGREETQNWAEDKIALTYYQRKLTSFLTENPVMKIMRPKMSNMPQGPVTALIETSNKLEAVQILMRTMKETGIEPKHFDANVLFDMELAAIQDATATLHKLLVPLTSSKTLKETPKLMSFRSPEYQTGSSQYASATSEAGSDNSVDLQRMTLGPSGSSMLHERKANANQNHPGTAYAPLNSDRMHTFFNAAMDRFLKEQQTARTQLMTQPHTDPRGMRDVEMGSVGSHSGYQGEFDPDDLSIDIPRPALVASAGVSSGNQARAGVAAPRIRVSAISALKEFSGKDNDERSWLGKVKSAFVRDQALGGEKCLIFGDLLTGPDWYRQLSRFTRSNWKDLLGKFQTQYCGQGVSVARQYYHARKRSDESPLEYLHRLNVAGLRAKLQIKDGPEATRRDHVEHYIETLDDRDLADHLAILRLADEDALEDTLRAPIQSSPKEDTRYRFPAEGDHDA
ncbi:LOW QUALITY PROTEIN: Hypothetical protein PHPALM_18295 [Phytophthora palmivora]|uniref:Retrotransposon gag domain-containing protein n=1 Tax=Phytophthora palmivora TaxID=4796 RepID=A0A2P4XK33_9STRA|nr:LOW QUALITY PROTEIN: Hypothetical protein PHPALM_18295 [Phytophthora palmivora]